MKRFNWGEGQKQFARLFDKLKYVLLVILAGVILMIVPFGSGGDTKKTQDSQEESFSLEETERRIEKALSQIQGAGEVTLVLTVKSGTERVLAQDEEISYQETGEDKELKSSVTNVIVSQGSGAEDTVVTKSIHPEYQGALAVCRGAGDAKVRLQVTAAIAALTGLGTDKISVVQMEG
ncbi:hypothetical protein [Papillibacter cinnamivorans]|uniref:Stage III sporulation protein AG n=1 Tax=Papillibacter cinnamivorans DSM 12816 TaxID=1122930 RepID=A0A1W2CK27_9FIRM|nr:hypothetical protein [Papillibacter cinnamivorans]SMC85541.1 stage III sporulation protein AG [Papillibacter cinnamivorans DSM 12816]